jgi:hypothetical protein
MAAGPFVFSQPAKLNFLEAATGLLKTGSANYRLALLSSAWTPAPTTDEVWATMSANEIAGGTGYTTGGATLTSVVLSQTGGVVKFTSAAQVWTATGGSIAAWRYMMIYYLGTLNGKVNPIVAYALGDSTPADVPATTVGNTLTVTPNASGILSAT